MEAAERTGADLVIAERAFTKGQMPTARFYSNRIGSRILSSFIGTEVADSQSGFRLIRADRLRRLELTATGYEIETEMLIKLTRAGASLERISIPARYHGAKSKLRSFRDTFRTCMLAVRYRYLTRHPEHRMSDDARPDEGRWHQHGLSTGTIFGLTRWGVSHLPKAVSYAIGHVGTWLAFHLMKAETAALIDNYRVILPDLGERELRALALRAYRTYACEVIDFIRSTSKTPEELWTWMSPLNNFDRVGRPGDNGFLFLTAHVGNIELGAVVLRALYEYRLAVVLLPEHDPRVHQHRLEMRQKMGIDTIEVRQDAETALRIRRYLSGGGTVAMVADRPLGRDRVEVDLLRAAHLLPAVARHHGLSVGRADDPVVHPAPAGRQLRGPGARSDLRRSDGRSRDRRAGGDAGVRHGARGRRPAVPAPLVQLLPVLEHGRRPGRGHRVMKSPVNWQLCNSPGRRSRRTPVRRPCRRAARLRRRARRPGSRCSPGPPTSGSKNRSSITMSPK